MLAAKLEQTMLFHMNMLYIPELSALSNPEPEIHYTAAK